MSAVMFISPAFVFVLFAGMCVSVAGHKGYPSCLLRQ